jgi:hypothetical protein
MVFSSQANARYLFKHCIGQSRERGLHNWAQPCSPADLGRLDAEDHHLWQGPSQCIGQRQDLAQAGVVEGEAVCRLSQPGLIRREADKLARPSSNVGSVYYDYPLPPLQHLQQVQPSGPSVKGRHPLRQPTAGQFLHHPWADPVVTAQGIAQADDENSEGRISQFVIRLSPLAHTNSTVRK